MTSLTRIKSILDFPLRSFPQFTGRYNDLYELRATCTRAEGYFLLKLDGGDHFESSFPLMLDDAGAYMLGQIIATESKHRPGAIYYDVYIHGGSLDASAFCVNPKELADMLRELDTRGMEYVFVENEVWGLTGGDERPFDEVFVEFPSDLRFAIMFGEDVGSDDSDNKSLKRLEEYFEERSE